MVNWDLLGFHGIAVRLNSVHGWWPRWHDLGMLFPALRLLLHLAQIQLKWTYGPGHGKWSPATTAGVWGMKSGLVSRHQFLSPHTIYEWCQESPLFCIFRQNGSIHLYLQRSCEHELVYVSDSSLEENITALKLYLDHRSLRSVDKWTEYQPIQKVNRQLWFFWR